MPTNFMPFRPPRPPTSSTSDIFASQQEEQPHPPSPSVSSSEASYRTASEHDPSYNGSTLLVAPDPETHKPFKERRIQYGTNHLLPHTYRVLKSFPTALCPSFYFDSYCPSTSEHPCELTHLAGFDRKTFSRAVYVMVLIPTTPQKGIKWEDADYLLSEGNWVEERVEFETFLVQTYGNLSRTVQRVPVRDKRPFFCVRFLKEESAWSVLRRPVFYKGWSCVVKPWLDVYLRDGGYQAPSDKATSTKPKTTPILTSTRPPTKSIYHEITFPWPTGYENLRKEDDVPRSRGVSPAAEEEPWWGPKTAQMETVRKYERVATVGREGDAGVGVRVKNGAGVRGAMEDGGLEEWEARSAIGGYWDVGDDKWDVTSIGKETQTKVVDIEHTQKQKHGRRIRGGRRGLRERGHREGQRQQGPRHFKQESKSSTLQFKVPDLLDKRLTLEGLLLGLDGYERQKASRSGKSLKVWFRDSDSALNAFQQLSDEFNCWFANDNVEACEGEPPEEVKRDVAMGLEKETKPIMEPALEFKPRAVVVTPVPRVKVPGRKKAEERTWDAGPRKEMEEVEDDLTSFLKKLGIVGDGDEVDGGKADEGREEEGVGNMSFAGPQQVAAPREAANLEVVTEPCERCLETGHTKDECKNPSRCKRCKGIGHEAWKCLADDLSVWYAKSGHTSQHCVETVQRTNDGGMKPERMAGRRVGKVQKENEQDWERGSSEEEGSPVGGKALVVAGKEKKKVEVKGTFTEGFMAGFLRSLKIGGMGRGDVARDGDGGVKKEGLLVEIGMGRKDADWQDLIVLLLV
ncbi:hypothetical protein HK097_008869 [Rhizophlyctis rosea]|uniref:CCHC-type domain-containing protein n=1 Tax=Rhizophlyctis rosea TaxID=64517 RepID=A0AAD5SCI0_9FUNG|nr:hypothetical protein HK097_008869 [Rhizophlyctis rosea]